MTRPVILLHPASDSRYRAYPRISLLAWWLTFGQVGLPRFREVTHWVTLMYFILRLAEVPTIWAFLAQGDIFPAIYKFSLKSLEPSVFSDFRDICNF